MLRTIARTTDVEPGHVRAFEIREDGTEAVGRSRIPLPVRSYPVRIVSGEVQVDLQRGPHPSTEAMSLLRSALPA